MPSATGTPVARPRKSQPRDRLDLRVDPDWMLRIARQADRFGMPVAAYIRAGATEKLERDEGTDPSPPKPAAR
jgi:hypothetical protein